MDVNICSTSSFPCPLSLAFSVLHPLNRAGSLNCRAAACSKRRQRVFCAATTDSNENSPVPDSSSGRSQAQARQPSELDPAAQFSSLANAFSRRLALGIVGASIVAIGGNLGGITSLLLGFEPQISRDLKLDAVYPVRGYKRCIDTSNGFGLWKDLVPRTSLGLGSKYANIYLPKFGNLAKVGWGRAQQEWNPGKLVNNSLTSPVT